VADPKDVLERSRTVAVVGMSSDPEKDSHAVPLALRKAGFRIIPVHPTAAEIAGEKAYPTLADVPEPIDVVEVFRPADEAPGIARQAVDAGARAVWLQLGLRSDEARRIAEDAGLDYVEDHCMGVERARHGIRKGR
jgi:predicted CoA-binding protein